MADAQGLDEIKEIAEKSGNSLHYRVANFLKAKGWELLISPYYADEFTDKPREIDIVAEKDFDFSVRNTRHTTRVRLFIECKFIAKKTLFWFGKKDLNAAVEKLVRETPLKRPAENVLIKNHHYYSVLDAAKLFDSAGAQPDREIVYRAISQSLNALRYFGRDPLRIQHKPPHALLHAVLVYPCIVCDSFQNFYKINAEDETGKIERLEDNFQLEVNYTGVGREAEARGIEYFLIDVINFQNLGSFLEKVLVEDIKAIQWMFGD